MRCRQPAPPGAASLAASSSVPTSSVNRGRAGSTPAPRVTRTMRIGTPGRSVWTARARPCARHLCHQAVGYDQIEGRTGPHDGELLLGARGREHLVAELAQPVGGAQPHQRLVVDEKRGPARRRDRRFHDRRRGVFAFGPLRRSELLRGQPMDHRQSEAGVLADASVEKNDSIARCRISSAMPAPVSATNRRTYWLRRRSIDR